jgi:triosephosphate isomerase
LERDILTIIVLNFKTYKEATGEAALRLAQTCDDVAKEFSAEIAVAPQIVDIHPVAEVVDIPIYSQHVDGAGYGSFTGYVTAASIKAAGATGSLLNHSERRLKLADIGAGITACRAFDLKTIVCTNDVATTRAAAALKPDYVAVEPPELIGSGVPVSKADPEVVRGSVAAVKKIEAGVGVLCGAGITHGEDLKAAVGLGSEGVLLASGIVKAKDQRKALEDLIGGLR